MSKWFGKNKVTAGSSVEQLVAALDEVLERHSSESEEIAGKVGQSIEIVQTRFIQQLIQVESDIAKRYEDITAKWDHSVARVEASVEKLNNPPIQAAHAMIQSVDGLRDVVETLNKSLLTLPDRTAACFDKPTQQLSQQFTQMVRAFGDQVYSFKTTAEALAGYVEQISRLSGDIENMLKVQQSVETAVKGIEETRTFQQTMSDLGERLSEMGRVVEMAAKPRVITLIEEEPVQD